MPASIISIWTLSLMLGAAGLGLLVRACWAGAWGAASLARCAECGYPTEGLETDVCPECGRRAADAARSRLNRRRVRAGAAGLALLALAALGFPMSDALRFGIAHALPTITLVEGLRWAPAYHGVVGVELEERAGLDRMARWERRELGRVCLSVLAGASDPAARRTAARLIAHVSPDTQPGAEDALLGDHDPVIRATGVEVYWNRCPGDALRDRIRAMAADDPSPIVRRRAAVVLLSLARAGQGSGAAVVGG